MKQICGSPERRSYPTAKEAQETFNRTHGHNIGAMSSMKEEASGEGLSECVEKIGAGGRISRAPLHEGDSPFM
jgi:hypothetical protein